MNFGIIGTNWITERFIEAGRTVKDFRVQAVYSRKMERAKEFASQVGAPDAYDSLQEMVSSALIDAVYIASPNVFHAEQTIRAMEAGKHVLCEKPACSTVKEWTAMEEAARSNDVVLMEALKSIYLPNFLVLQGQLDRVGQIRRVFASYCQYSSRYDAFKQGTILNAFDPSLSNGALMDLGVYVLHPVIKLFGAPSAIRAQGTMLSNGVDGMGSILLQYEDMEATLMYSKISDSYLPAEIQGEEGTLHVDTIHTPASIQFQARGGQPEDVSVPQTRPPMSYEIEAFFERVASSSPMKRWESLEASRQTMSALEEIRRQIGIRFPADEMSGS